MFSGDGSLEASTLDGTALYSHKQPIEIAGGTLKLTGYSGINCDDNNVTISGGTVNAYGTANDGILITNGNLYIKNGGQLVATGNDKAILNSNSYTINDISGIGWTDVDGTVGKAVIPVSASGQTLEYKKVQFPATMDDITATAGDVTVTYDGKAHGITVSVTNPATGAIVKYGETDGTYDLDESPTITDVADSPKTIYYKVKAGGYNDKTGSATVTINAADPTTPTGLTATPGQTLADVTLPEGWAWVDNTLDVGDVGTNTFKADYMPTSANYHSKSHVNVSVTKDALTVTPTRQASRTSRRSSRSETSSSSKWSTVAGDDRFQTMEDVVLSTFSQSEWAVLSSSSDFPDALTSSSLAGVLGCPVVTTASGGLSPEAADVLMRLGVTHVAVVGGESSVSQGVLDALEAMGIEVTRVAGDSRSATALAVLKQGQLMGGSPDTVFISTSSTFADVLSIGPLSYLGQSPIVLTEDGVLSEEALKAISEGGFAKVVILGGAASVSPEVEAQLHSIGVTTVKRVAGEDRYDTSGKIAEYATGNDLGLAHVTATTGAGFSDALVGAAYAARQGGVLLLVGEDSTVAEDLLRSHASEFVSGTVLGGTDSVPASLVQRLEDAVA